MATNRALTGVLLCTSAVIHVESLAAADEYALAEPYGTSRVFQVETRMRATGTLTSRPALQKPITMRLQAEARFRFRERRLSSAGSQARALRAVRYYDRASATAVVEKNVTRSALRDSRRLIVAEGAARGLQSCSLNGPLTRGEVDLLDVPADSLAMLAMAPPEAVAVGEQWKPPRWAARFITATDVVHKTDISCRLASVANGQARVDFTGSLEGADDGAATRISIEGHYLFDLKGRYLKRLELQQKEKAAQTPVTPEIDVSATVTIERTPAGATPRLSDAIVRQAARKTSESLRQLEYFTPWGIRFSHGRNWRLYRQTPHVAILRLIENSRFVCQVNISRIADKPPGRHTSEREFQTDVRRELGPRLDKIVKAERVKSRDGSFIYRVAVAGRQNASPMTWIYYLCAAASGRQVALVFSLEPSMERQLDNRDLEIVKGLRFR